jgi:hypothetical protein
MSDNPNGQVLDYLREQFARLHTKLDHLAEDVTDLKRRMTSLEAQVALLHGDFANQSAHRPAGHPIGAHRETPGPDRNCAVVRAERLQADTT